MRKILYNPNRNWLFIKRWALHHETIIIEYFCNLGRVSKQIYKSEDIYFDTYIAKNNEQQITKAEEGLKLMKKTKKEEVC